MPYKRSRATPFVLAAALLAALVSSPATQAADDWTEFEIDQQNSWLRVMVYRGGILRGLGHNHTVSHRNLRGAVRLAADARVVDVMLRLNVEEFLVDDPQDRTAEGEDFPGTIAAEDIAATRANMLGPRLLDGSQYPEVGIRVAGRRGDLPNVELDVVVTLLGVEHELRVPAKVTLQADTLRASGEVSIRHRDIGLKPFKAALGALRVRKDLLVRFQIQGVQPVKSSNLQ